MKRLLTGYLAILRFRPDSFPGNARLFSELMGTNIGSTHSISSGYLAIPTSRLLAGTCVKFYILIAILILFPELGFGVRTKS